MILYHGGPRDPDLASPAAQVEVQRGTREESDPGVSGSGVSGSVKKEVDTKEVNTEIVKTEIVKTEIDKKDEKIQYRLKDEYMERIVKDFVKMDRKVWIDCFASEETKQFEVWWRSAFEEKWNREEILWLNPPFELWERVSARVMACNARCI